MRYSAEFLWLRAYLVARAEERRILDKSALRETGPWAQFEGCMVAIRVGGGDLEGVPRYLDRRRWRRRMARAFRGAALAARFGLAENGENRRRVCGTCGSDALIALAPCGS